MIRSLTITALVAVGMAYTGATKVMAHCGACKGDEKDHVHTLKEYKKGACCSAEHYVQQQKKEIAAKAKAEYKDGACCSADHFAAKKVKAVEMATIKAAATKEYKKGLCCSAEHYAKKKVKEAEERAKK